MEKTFEIMNQLNSYLGKKVKVDLPTDNFQYTGTLQYSHSCWYRIVENEQEFGFFDKLCQRCPKIVDFSLDQINIIKPNTFSWFNNIHAIVELNYRTHANYPRFR